MESVVAGAAIYMSLLVFTRVTGRRTMAQTTVFDVVLLLILAETTQGYLLRDDPSFTNFLIVLATMGLIDVVLSLVKLRSPLAEALIDGTPTVLIRDGKLLDDKLRRTRVTEDDLMEAARAQHGLAQMSDIEAAVLETGGGISIVPKPS